jgi:hypothetical protein
MSSLATLDMLPRRPPNSVDEDVPICERCANLTFLRGFVIRTARGGLWRSEKLKKDDEVAFPSEIENSGECV